MVQLFGFSNFRYSMLGQPLWYASIWSHVTCHDNTKFLKSSIIGVWSYFGARFQYEGVVCQIGPCAGFIQ
jgi:hypothetical protein